MSVLKFVKGYPLAFFPTRASHRLASSVLLAVTLALFAIGSPSGSLDINNDDNPEIPIAVLSPSRGVNSPRVADSDRRPKALTDLDQLLFACERNHAQGIRVSQLASHKFRSAPSSFALLRC